MTNNDLLPINELESHPSSNGTKAAENPTWTPFATENPAFDDYYKVVASQERYVFVRVLRSQLPATFRINARTGN